jgi:carboxylesterase
MGRRAVHDAWPARGLAMGLAEVPAMSQSPYVSPSAFLLPGGPIGVLLLHGFTGSPPEMRLVGDYLNARGLTVSGPLLPGHGTTTKELDRSTWAQWTDSARTALMDLRQRCSTVFVAGLSMGALVALHAAAHHPFIAGTLAYSPAVRLQSWQIELIPVLKYFIGPQGKRGKSDMEDPQAERYIWSYDQYAPVALHELLRLQNVVRQALPQVRCPLLVVYSLRDRTIHHNAGPYVYEHAGSADKELLVLRRSGHVITVDSDWEKVAQRSYEFIMRRAGGNAAETDAGVAESGRIGSV